MQSLGVALGERSYPIHVGANLIERADLIVPHLDRRQLAIVTNVTVAPLLLESLSAPLRRAGVEVFSAVIPDGEAYKTWDTANLIFDALLEHRCGRDTTLLALGGGVVGDLAGFAAALYQRGIGFIQVPTTLLAQVDSSVGGKTAINHRLGKNMVGAFHQPRLVLADVAALRTLPLRELRAGLAEVIKHGLIADDSFFAWLEANMDRLLALDEEALTHAVVRSIEIKAAIVAQDERETGVRALLNFGHTFGHAIETGLGYGEWLHGEAVAAGMAMACDLSRRLGGLADAECARVCALLARTGLPVDPPALPAERFRALMSVDKKARQGRLRFVLLEGIGAAAVCSDVPDAALNATLSQRQAV